ncbi:glycerol-3-phosphate dehydrogenase-like protein [Leishmania infantum JPCM5]|uniref:Glycerol-3-phosphate dehydrogenase-like protein n=2 Tax=Leishmania infantum TaxID=5671 RepID=A4HYM4_LEIIN|nr:glycerol-3-phosphate dehydrogenase-like protein [Leishmania infantum JPCM5]CAC9484222.1 glycerol-3-phosphate_dehydrogenase-like_protein [Leishmania infantum]CAM67412.1 glycerol-3-phosphate dehydrogenase-like protein [Leishmania infantum JPCM5]SUZ41326.1 glycerol-3-phosphate_dehydrogenase-like_protein [Leishmania infantum]|eukprot:XP_001465165.1 glycerol-3-phosphate dehydrogenase-like protein [Leishmania infantum JPCM5]
MSRHSRKLHVRLLRAAVVVAAGTFAYRRWCLRPYSALSASAYRPANGADHYRDSPAPRSSRWAALQRSSAADPFDLLVIGGGLTGLYTAVDAAQRGLRVALVDAADFGGGSAASCMPSVSPGALPYVQRALRQRDWDWLRMAATVLVEETTWRNVAPRCVVAPDTLLRRWQNWRWRGTVGGSGCEAASKAGAAEDGTTAVLHSEETSAKAPSLLPFDPTPATTTLLPALHSTEMVEYVCAAILSTVMSIFCGPLRPNLVLPGPVVQARLPALAPSSGPSPSPARLRGGIIANDFALRGNTVAVSLARTAEELGVTVLSYAPVFAIQEVSAPATTEMEMSSPSSSTRASSCAGVMLVSVRDALAAKAVAASLPASPDRSRPRFLQRLLGQSSASSPSSTADSAASPRSAVWSPDAATTTHVYTRGVVNCTGCWADTVKAMFDGNASDTVPAAFAGYQAYSYLIAPANAVHAAPPPSTPPTDSHGVGQGAVASLPPLSETMRAAALLFSSPRLSFASVMVLPWWDRCVMLGPSISSLPRLPATVTAHTNGLLHSVDGYAAQRQRTLSMLRSSGVSVDASRLLSCVSQIVPHVKGPKEVPWTGALLHRGYALHFSSVPLPKRGDQGDIEELVSLVSNCADATGDAVAVARRDVPLLHVYGGTPLLARRIAEEAVDALVYHEPPLFSEKTRKKLHRCRTRYLQLTTPASLCTTTDSGPMNARARLETLVKDTYAERVVDVVARRTHTAYTSPAEALQAIPTLASVMGGLLQWDEARRFSEVEAARRLVHSVAVTV